MFASKDVFLTPPSGGYTIARSVRTRASASAYFNRTLTTPTSANTWTLSVWLKRGILGSSYQSLFGTIPSTGAVIYYAADSIVFWKAGAAVATSTAVYRDPSAWYHLVINSNGTTVTAYINNVNVLSYTGTLANINSANAHYIGTRGGLAEYFDGYLTEINFIDGQALTPSSFGSTNAITGVWQPAKYTGTYGTNGFYLNFSDNSNNTATTIGKDYSGNGNNWTPNNISVTAGSTYDSMTDVPTLTSATAANYCVMNSNDQTNQTVTGGNLNTASNNTSGRVRGTLGVSTGKWYFEHTLTAYASGGTIGIYNINVALGTGDMGTSADSWGYITNTGNKQNNSVGTAYGSSSTTNDIVMCALDLDNGKIWWGKNGTWFASGDPAAGTNAAFTNVTGYTVTPTVGIGTGSVQSWAHNFGQRPFSYTPPTGYVALNTFNLPDSTIKNGAGYMAATLYTGNGTSQTIANTASSASFQPDLIWTKSRGSAGNHSWVDSVRGTSLQLSSSQTAAEVTDATEITAITSTGFSVGASSGAGYSTNASTVTYVGWQWKAGGTSASNTNGSITSTVSAGATQGFSVVTYTGTGANATVGHGLGVAPSMYIVKSRSLGTNWPTYHIGLTSASYRLFLDLTNAQGADVAWNNTAPTSTVFSIGPTGYSVNNSGATYVAYCFAAVKGFSAFGSYTGNGSADGPFVYTGFRPRWLLLKNTGGVASWYCLDSSRNTYNVEDAVLVPNTSAAEVSITSVDFLSNGFKLRTTTTDINGSGTTYIYACFAENPMKNSLAR
jgi:hypothetical protein